MTDRPTPEEIAEDIATAFRYSDVSPSDLLAAFTCHGYRIVHPDDVPEMSDHPVCGESYNAGWDACRRHIFGGA